MPVRVRFLQSAPASAACAKERVGPAGTKDPFDFDAELDVTYILNVR